MRGLALAVVMGIAVLTAILGTPAYAGDLLPSVPKASSGTCVEDPMVMRKNHMDFLAHQRDATLREGIRGAKHSLKDCVSCHVQPGADGKALPINAEGQFCQSCHAYAAVSMDCFQCHATVPGANPATAGR